MYNPNNPNGTALAESANFILPAPMSSDFTAEDLAEDMEGLQITFPQVKIPGGGVLQFELASEDPERPDYAAELEGVILYNHSSNAYWPTGNEYDDNTPPLCQSMDGKIGCGEPGGLCASCAFNRFGSGPNGSGKACKNMRMLYLLRSGDYLPLQLSLPPTSLRPFNNFVNAAFMLRRRPVYGSIVRIGLKKAESNGFTYSVATFRKVRDFSGEEMASIKEFAEGFREQLRMEIAQRTAEKEMAAGTGVEISAAPISLPDNDEHFSIGVIDGERVDLPA